MNIDKIENTIINGDLSNLNQEERLAYYNKVCDSLGLNPYTKPFDYIRLNNKLTLYARRDATDQLRKIHNISIEITKREMINGVYIVEAKASEGSRLDVSLGAVNIEGLKGDNLANALMKAETKAKRRVTLSIVGLGWLDETEIESISEKEINLLPKQNGNIANNPQPKEKIIEKKEEITEIQKSILTYTKEKKVKKEVVISVLKDWFKVERANDVKVENQKYIIPCIELYNILINQDNSHNLEEFETLYEKRIFDWSFEDVLQIGAKFLINGFPIEKEVVNQ